MKLKNTDNRTKQVSSAEIAGKRKFPKTAVRILIIFALLIVILISAMGIYAADYSRADKMAVAAAADNTAINITEYKSAILFDAGNTEAILLFYPGGKVEYTAYEPLMIDLAEKGISCLLIKMPFNLAVFDVNAADDYLDITAAYNSTYIGGHSLGGSMAASYASSHMDTIEGLILLASYATSDLTAEDFSAISIYGSRDGVLNMENYQKNKSNLPADTKEIIIQGGNHAGFGNYGSQKGDNEADISKADQQEQTAEAIVSFILDKAEN